MGQVRVGSIPYITRISMVAMKGKVYLRVGCIPCPPGATMIFAFANACFSIGSLVHPLPIRPFPRAPYVIEARILGRWWDESPCFASFREPYDVYLWLKAWKNKRVDEWETQGIDAAKMAMLLVPFISIVLARCQKSSKSLIKCPSNSFWCTCNENQ